MAANLRIVIKVSATNKPKNFIDAVGRCAGIGSDTHDSLKKGVVVSLTFAQTECGKQIVQVSVRFGKLVVAQLFQEIARQREAEAMNFLAQ